MTHMAAPARCAGCTGLPARRVAAFLAPDRPQPSGVGAHTWGRAARGRVLPKLVLVADMACMVSESLLVAQLGTQRRRPGAVRGLKLR